MGQNDSVRLRATSPFGLSLRDYVKLADKERRPSVAIDVEVHRNGIGHYTTHLTTTGAPAEVAATGRDIERKLTATTADQFEAAEPPSPLTKTRAHAWLPQARPLTSREDSALQAVADDTTLHVHSDVLLERTALWDDPRRRYTSLVLEGERSAVEAGLAALQSAQPTRLRTPSDSIWVVNYVGPRQDRPKDDDDVTPPPDSPPEVELDWMDVQRGIAALEKLANEPAASRPLVPAGV